jgi:hypothetical protein
LHRYTEELLLRQKKEYSRIPRVKDRAQRLIRTYLGIKMTPAGRADALAGVISPEPITAVSRKSGKANSIAFPSDNRNSSEGQPRKACLAQMI